MNKCEKKFSLENYIKQDFFLEKITLNFLKENHSIFFALKISINRNKIKNFLKYKYQQNELEKKRNSKILKIK